MVLSMVLYMVLSDTLADRCMEHRQQVQVQRILYFYISEASYKLDGDRLLATAAGWISFIEQFLLIGRKPVSKARRGAEGAERLHPYRQTNKACHSQDESYHASTCALSS